LLQIELMSGAVGLVMGGIRVNPAGRNCKPAPVPEVAARVLSHVNGGPIIKDHRWLAARRPSKVRDLYFACNGGQWTTATPRGSEALEWGTNIVRVHARLGQLLFWERPQHARLFAGPHYFPLLQELLQAGLRVVTISWRLSQGRLILFGRVCGCHTTGSARNL